MQNKIYRVTFSALCWSVPSSVIPSSHTRILLREKFAVLVFCFFCWLKCSQFLLHFMMRKMGRGSRKYHIYVFICAGKLKILPQKSQYSKCLHSWLKVLLLQKSSSFFFFPMHCQSNQGREEHTWSTCEKPSCVIKSEPATMQPVTIWICLFIGLLCNPIIIITVTSFVLWNYCLTTSVTDCCWARSLLNMTALPEALNKTRPQSICVLQVLAGTVLCNTGEWEEEDTAGDVRLCCFKWNAVNYS